MEIHLKIIGTLHILLALMHIGFPKYFNWKKELQSLDLLNKQMMLVHTFFIALVVFLIGFLCLVQYHNLIDTEFGKFISLGLAIFWTSRLIIQFVGYSSKLWLGKTFETCVHILFSLLWLYFSLVFWMNYFDKIAQ